MRAQTSLELAPGRLVTVRELRVRDLRQLLGLLTPERLAQPWPTPLTGALPELLALAGDGLELPPGEVLDDLTLSECEAIGAAWWGIHRDFFQAALRLLHADAAPSTPSPSASAPTASSAPASDSPSAESTPPGTGAGASS